MSYQTILVHVDQSRHAPARLACAAGLARRHGAHLLGAAMLGVSRHVFPAGFDERPGTLSASYMEPLAAAAQRALDQFEQVARAHGLSYEARFVCDQADDGLARLARFADLVVLSQDDPDEALPDMAVQLPEFVILNSARPVLVVPRSAGAAAPGAEPAPVLAAWNGSREAAAALAGALPLLRTAPQVTVAALTGPDLGSEDLAAQQPDLAAYLERHGIHARCLDRPATHDAGAQLLALAAELGCGMLVMGCYGHTRLHELCLGGASRTVLARATLPVLYAHH